jgi:hypothetical protein
MFIDGVLLLAADVAAAAELAAASWSSYEASTSLLVEKVLHGRIRVNPEGHLPP